MSIDERPALVTPRRRPAQAVSDRQLLNTAARSTEPRSRYPRRHYTLATEYDVCGSLCGHPIREGHQIVHLDGRPHHLEHFT